MTRSWSLDLVMHADVTVVAHAPTSPHPVPRRRPVAATNRARPAVVRRSRDRAPGNAVDHAARRRTTVPALPDPHRRRAADRLPTTRIPRPHDAGLPPHRPPPLAARPAADGRTPPRRLPMRSTPVIAATVRHLGAADLPATRAETRPIRASPAAGQVRIGGRSRIADHVREARPTPMSAPVHLDPGRPARPGDPACPGGRGPAAPESVAGWSHCCRRRCSCAPAMRGTTSTI